MSQEGSHTSTDADANKNEQAESGSVERSVDTGTPGGMLYQGRLDKQYSVEQLCAQTKLTPPTVAALESNDFQALPQSVFVRGYYRQCAKALGLDADRIAAAYTAMAGDEQNQQVDNARQAAQQAVAPGTVVAEDSGGRSYGLYFLFAILIAIVVALLVIPAPQDDEQEQDDDSEPAQATQSESSRDEDDASAGKQSSDESSEQQSHDEHDDDEPGGRNINQSLGISAAERASEDNEDDNEDAASSVPANKLVLKFDGDSWVSVTDADGKRLVYGLHEADDEKEVEGKAPYKVTLGAASNVKAKLGGEDVDIKSHTVKGGTARFTLDEDTDDKD